MSSVRRLVEHRRRRHDRRPAAGRQRIGPMLALTKRRITTVQLMEKSD
jgi:hypothetical protein